MMRMWYDDQSVDESLGKYIFISNQLKVLMGGVKWGLRGVKGRLSGGNGELMRVIDVYRINIRCE